MKPATPPTLRSGDTGPHVALWQLHGLASRGLLSDADARGKMDAATIAATMVYQRRAGLHPDGIVGPLTWGYAGFLRNHHGRALRFDAPVRKKAVRGILIHHSVTRATKAATPELVDYHANKRVYDVLVSRGLSTDAIIGPYGRLDRCTDPATQRSRHAGAYSLRWLGVDLAAPLDVDVSRDLDDEIWPILVEAPFAPAADGRLYHADTEAALVTLDGLLREWCEEFEIPYVTSAIEHTIAGAGPDTLPPGVYAHGHVSDNRWDGHAALRGMREMGIGPVWK